MDDLTALVNRFNATRRVKKTHAGMSDRDYRNMNRPRARRRVIATTPEHHPVPADLLPS